MWLWFLFQSGVMELGQNKKGPKYIARCSHFRERLHAVGTVYLMVMDAISSIHHHIQSAVLPKFIKTRVRLCFTNDARTIYKSRQNTIQGNKNLDVKRHTPCCTSIYIALHAYILYTAVVHLCTKIQLLTSGSVGKTPWRPVVLLLAVSGFCSPTITPTIPRNLRQESGCSRIYNNRTSPRDVVLP